MKAITIRELHQSTGAWLRRAPRLGEIRVTERGRTIAKIVPAREPPPVPYFARWRPSASFRRLFAAGKLRGGKDGTAMISEARGERPH